MRSKFIATAVVAAVVGACGYSQSAPTSSPPADTPARSGAGLPPMEDLEGGAWAIIRITIDNALVTIPDGVGPLTLAVDSGVVRGRLGCNSFDATLKVDYTSGDFSLTNIEVTEIGCAPEVMAIEAALLDALARVEAFASDGGWLTLTSRDPSVLLDLETLRIDPDAPFDVTAWVLTGFSFDGIAIPLLAGTSPTLYVSADSVKGNGGCNDFGAAVVFDAETISISNLITTEVVCSEAVMSQEARYFDALTKASLWWSDGSKLRIFTTDQATLTFSETSL